MSPKEKDQEKQKIFTALQEGEFELQGRFVFGSNYTFLANLVYQGESLITVYKPEKGERPLWDFPPGTLGKRETAAFLVSEGLGWNFVPPTFYRQDGPYGPGSLQLFIEHDPQITYFDFTPEDRQRLQRVAVFDIFINNADRKGSHVIKDGQGFLWLIDHGICFHEQEKLRTVIWDFAGQEIAAELLQELEAYLQELENGSTAQGLELYLSVEEIQALIRRGRWIIENGTFPEPDENRRSFPWPPV